MSAAAHRGIAVSTTAMTQAVSAANANTPKSPAAPNIPAPAPAFSLLGQLGLRQLELLLTSVPLCSESSFSRSPTGLSRMSSGPGAQPCPPRNLDPGPGGGWGRRGQAS